MLSWMTFAALGLVAPPFMPEVVDWRLFTSLALLSSLLPLGPWRSRFLALFLACGYSAHYCEQRSAQLPPAEWVSKNVVFDALILAPIEERKSKGRRYYRFDIVLASGQCAGDYCPKGRPRFRVNFYDNTPPQPGVWSRLQMRLRPPTGTQSQGAFDYAQWLMANGYAGRGYVKALLPLKAERPVGAVGHYHRLRNQLLNQAENQLSHLSHQGIIRALLFADRRDVRDVQWQLFARTGTSHLMAISGMHVGIVMAWGFMLARVAGLLFSRGGRRALVIGPLLAFSFALVYSAMAGFTLPTQRALIMAAVLCIGLVLQRHISPWQGWQAALVLVLLRDPLVVHSAGFYLSFGAVAVLLFLVVESSSPRPSWLRLISLQAHVLIVLFPVLAIWGFGSGLAALPANILAIPMLALLIMPTLFIGLLGGSCGPLGAGIFSLANGLIEYLFAYLAFLSELPFWQPSFSVLSIIGLLLAAGLLLLPRGVMGRPLAFVFAGIALLQPSAPPPPGHVWISILDVGQGLSVLVQKGRRALVYDTGPDFSGRYNSADAVLVPLLRQRGINELDRLVLSHGDRDHAGAADMLLKAMPAKQVLSGEPERHHRFSAKDCHQAPPWEWGDTKFAFLHYAASVDGKSNNRSCVLLVRQGDHRMLLTGDIERNVEAELARTWPAAAKLNLLLAAHHGSKSSSSPVFLHATQAKQVVFAASRFNAYGHPAASVIERFRRQNSRCWQTGIHGSVHFDMSEKGVQLRGYQAKKRYFWQAEPKDVCAGPYSEQ